MNIKLPAVMLLASCCAAGAQERVDVPLNGSVRIELRQPARTIVVPDQGVLRVEPVFGSDRTLRLVGEGRGTTTLSAQNDAGNVFYTAIVSVGTPERTIKIIGVPGGRAQKHGSNLNLHDEYTYHCNDTGCRSGKDSRRDRRLDSWTGAQPGEEQRPATQQTPPARTFPED